MEVKLRNDASELARAHEALDEMTARMGVLPQKTAALHLALEEHLANIISYGYSSGQSGVITLRFSQEAAMLRLEVEDDGRPFNPMETPTPNTALPLDHKPMGGLGIHMMRKAVPDLEYRQVQGRNLLILKQRIEG